MISLRLTHLPVLPGVNPKISELYLIGYYGKKKIKVICSVDEFYHSNDKIWNLSYKEFRRALSRKLNVNFDFTITKIDCDKEPTIYVSKVKADNIKIYKNYFETNNVEIDEIVEATVTCVYPKSIYVDIFGYETVVNISDMLFTKAENLRAFFSVGNKVKVLVREKELDYIKKRVKRLDVSRKDIYLNKRADLIEKYNISDYVAGYIVYHSHDQITVLLRDGLSVNIRTFRKLSSVQLYQKVTVEITNIDYTKGQLYGRIQQTLRDEPILIF